jgi:glycosyltransferase involved in cell wall biosynthesis
VAYTFYENDNRVVRYAEMLAERGDEVEVIALRRPGQSREGRSTGVRVRRIQRRAITEKHPSAYLLKILWFFAKSAVLLSALHLRRRWDVVHVHNVPDFLVFTAIVPKLTGARVILDIHDILPELYAGKFGVDERSWLFRTLLAVERWSCRFADHVIVANHLWHDKLARRALAPEACTVIMNYPDLRLFAPSNSPKTRTDGRFVLLYAGTLNHHQGLDIAIAAFALAKDHMPDSELHIYGEGPTRLALARQAEELGLADRIKLLDRVPLTEVPRVIATAGAGVVPKRADGFGNEAFSTKTLEFMACGVPVIVSRTRVDAYYFDDTLVRFFTPGDERDLAGAMISVYEHRQEHEAWLRSAGEFAARNSWQERGIDYLHIVERLTAAPRHEAVVR